MCEVALCRSDVGVLDNVSKISESGANVVFLLIEREVIVVCRLGSANNGSLVIVRFRLSEHAVLLDVVRLSEN